MNYSGIYSCDVVNGLGCRVSLFVAGCLAKCDGCFNVPQQDFNYGHKYTQETKEKLLELISRPYIKGLSILGGDPLWQDNDGLCQLIELCEAVHNLGKDIWIWSGFTWEQIFPKVTLDELSDNALYKQNLIARTDVFVDGRFEKDKKDLTLKWKGSSNQRVIDVRKSLEENKVVLFD